jgi:hypothetical protein
LTLQSYSPAQQRFPSLSLPCLGTRVLAAHPRRWHRRHQLLDSNPPGSSLPADRGGSVSAAASAFPNIRPLDLVRADPAPRRHVLAHDWPLRGLAREYTHTPLSCFSFRSWNQAAASAGRIASAPVRLPSPCSQPGLLAVIPSSARIITATNLAPLRRPVS